MNEPIYLTKPIPVQGINAGVESAYYTKAQSPYMMNCVIEQSVCRKRYGYSVLGAGSYLNPTKLVGAGMKLCSYVDAAGRKHLIAITSVRAYEYSQSTDRWVEITPMTLGSVTFSGTGLDDLTVNEPTDYVVGDFVVKISSTGTPDKFVWSKDDGDWSDEISITGSDQVLCSGLSIKFAATTEHTANSYWSFSTRSEFSGALYNRWSVCTATDTSLFTNNGGTALLITNGVNGVFCYEGHSGDYFKPVDLGIEGFGGANEIIEFWNHLFLLNYALSDRYCRSLLHSDCGNIREWEEGTSSSVTLTDTKGQILRAVPLGTALVIYSENSITMCRYFGGLTVFSFPTLIYETGLLAGGAVWSSTNVHFFLGTDQRVYAYFGETDLKPVGEDIEKMLFTMLDVSKKHLISTGIDLGRHKAMFALPSVGDDFSRDVLAFNYREQELSWEYYRFGHSVADFAILENYVGWYCDEEPWSIMYCDECTAYCDSNYGQVGYGKTCFISSDGYVFQLDEATALDYDRAIEFEMQTPDFTMDAEETFCRCHWFSFTARSNIPNSRVEISYSIDSGSTWTYIDNVELSTEWTTHRIPLDVLFRRIRFSLRQNDAVYCLRDSRSNVSGAYQQDIQLRGFFKCKCVPQVERD